ncbi:uncharacterized protein OCT59_005075 [Rhizophagus irregularis]|nr:hypothetical protein OCT59_005075 [Rhizophagus irregularis]
MDIPFNYDTSMLLKHLVTKTGSNIIEHKEIKKSPRKIPNRNRQGRPIFIKPAYKQLIVRFDQQSAFDYFMQENYWSLEIENFVISGVLKKRTSKYFRVTGLPLNTTARDIEPLIKYIYGRTCTFTQTTRNSTMKNAYIYVTPENYPEGSKNGASLIFEGHTIHIFPGHVSIKTCNICGSPLYASNECDDKNFITDKNNRKIFKKRFIDRKEEKITINEQSKNKYNHVISLNSNNNTFTSPQNIRCTQLQTGIQNHQQQSGNLLYPRNGQQQRNITGNDMNNYKRDHMYNTPHPNQPHVSSDNDTNQRITQLELQVKQLLNKIKTMEEEKSNTDTKISNINHNYDTLESSITDVKSRLDRYDSILQHLTNNITILSKKVMTTPKRPSKVVKRTTVNSLYSHTFGTVHIW